MMEVLRAVGAVVVVVLVLIPHTVLAGVEVQRVGPRNPSPPQEDTDHTTRRYHRVEHGSCTYTFVLPELNSCHSGLSRASGQDTLGRPAGSTVERLGRLEEAAKNNTAWLQKLERAMQEADQQQVWKAGSGPNPTVAMLELSTNLLTQTAEQTRKLSAMEGQVQNHTWWLEQQLQESGAATKHVEVQLLQHSKNTGRLREHTRELESRLATLGARQQADVQALRQQQATLGRLLSRQDALIRQLQRQLALATGNTSQLQQQQQELTESVHALLAALPRAAQQATEMRPGAEPRDERHVFKDCTDVLRSGQVKSGVYTISPGNSSQSLKVFCDMETDGGGWTRIQHREDGSLDFHRTWDEYKQGFGEPSGEHWLGNEPVHQLSRARPQQLRVELSDWAGARAFSLYDRFGLASERLNYRLMIKGFGGTAGRFSSLGQSGLDFSTLDSDHDNCACRCSLMATGGWWFDACGASNLNGRHYPHTQHTGKFNGVKWHYWKGSGYSLRETTMMIRPADFLP
uniref:angiopoietin-2-like n=2 Tax=Myxine glutinosa TaxID=7769 RepID=UPI00358FAC12